VSSKSAPIPVFESLRDASVRTGFSIPTLREKIDDGELPAYRISDKPNSPFRVRIADVDALMKPVPARGGTR
jgi:excisionase family DNA binding protein